MLRRLSQAAAILAFCVSAPTAAAGPARFDWFDYRGADPLPRPGPGEYGNPILQGFYPDPSITQVGDDYYLVTSTFAWFPGLPIFHSRDLVHWKQIGNAIDRPTQLDFGNLGLSRAVFAPDISWHEGTYYILNTCVDCGGNYVITARDPRGPWSDPVWLKDLEGGIDPSLFFDTDGSAWIINNGPPPGTPKYEGHRALWMQRFDARTLKTFGPRLLVLDGGVRPEEKPIWIEGPHIFRKDGYYYLIAAEGGTAEGHSQVVLRSRQIEGPWVPNPDNPILTQRGLPSGRPHPITSAGHADFVEAPNGEWWATFLAVRPYGDDLYNTGRETFLMPVYWEDGWPRITKPGQVIPWTMKRPSLPNSPAPPTSGPVHVREEFNGALPLDWMMMRQPRSRWWQIARGNLALTPRRIGIGDNGNPSLLARRQQHMHATATTAMRFDPSGKSEAGLVAMQSDEYWYSLTLRGSGASRRLEVKVRAGPNDPRTGRVLRSVSVPKGRLFLRIDAAAGRYGFKWSPDGRRYRTLVAAADGTLLSTKRAGGFVGAVFGLYAYDPDAQEPR